MTTVTDARDHLARMQIGIDVTDLPQLSRVLAHISRLANVVSARRRK
jgi:(p)ppGpp synthase/HD superfamily hydrolase